MDLSFIEHLIPDVAGWLNVEPATLVALIGFVLGACNLAGRLIPDDAEGVLGWVRRICKFLGVCASNRVSSGVKTSDVIKSVVGERVEYEASERIREGAEKVGALIPDVVHDIADEIPAEIVEDPFKKFAQGVVKGVIQ